MADPNKDRFEKRLAGLAGKTDPKNRVERKVTKDGLIIDVVKPARRSSLPVRGIVLVVVLFVCLKGALFAQLGQKEYINRVEKLKTGNSLEVTAAFLLDADPVTALLGRGFGRFMN